MYYYVHRTYCTDYSFKYILLNSCYNELLFANQYCLKNVYPFGSYYLDKNLLLFELYLLRKFFCIIKINNP